MNGLELLERVRQTWPQVRVYLATAYDTEATPNERPTSARTAISPSHWTSRHCDRSCSPPSTRGSANEVRLRFQDRARRCAPRLDRRFELLEVQRPDRRDVGLDNGGDPRKLEQVARWRPRGRRCAARSPVAAAARHRCRSAAAGQTREAERWREADQSPSTAENFRRRSTQMTSPSRSAHITSAGRLFNNPPSMSSRSPCCTGGRRPGIEIDARTASDSDPRRWTI